MLSELLTPSDRLPSSHVPVERPITVDRVDCNYSLGWGGWNLAVRDIWDFCGHVFIWGTPVFSFFNAALPSLLVWGFFFPQDAVAELSVCIPLPAAAQPP